jgi:DNA helicase-2/ATP-dependent DNA helicase PcrA
VVHAPAEENVMVRAGAGTGKTATMAERIVYLLATSRRDAVGVAYPYDLRLDDIALVTFTREAAQEMRARISTVLTDRRRLCCECVQPVLAWLSQLPGAQISTIHLLAKRIAQEGAAALGFTSGIRVGKLTIERREALAGALSSPLQRLTNMPMDVPASHEWITHLERIWDTASGNGVEILQSGPATNPRNVLDWGRPTSGRPNLLAQTVEDVLKSAARSFTETCQRLDTVRIDQLVPTAMDVLGTAGIGRVMLPRHLFVDEFQDTDAGQMDLLLALGLRHTIPMFVVGDVKQGVYHFRGAQGSAFRELSERVDDWISEATTAAEGQSRSTRRFAEYSLTYNFRTRAALLDSLAPYFAAWGGTTIGDDEPLLDYDTARDRLMPDPLRRRLPSSPIEFHSLRPREDWASATVDVVQALRRRPGGNDKTIAVLCRDNWQAREIQRALRDREEDCEIHAGGGFFRTEAVREARTFLRAVMDPGDDAALLQLCETRWLTGLFVGTMPFGIRESSISRWNAATRPPKIPWSSRLHALATTRRYDRSDLVDLRIRLTELRSLLHSVDPLAFLAQSRNDFTPQLCSRPSDTGSETARYDRCLDHLIAQLDQTFAGQPITIATMLTWLDLQIATNDHEDEPAPPPPGLRDSSTSVLTHAVTVHKAKGREYDYVVVPYVNGDFAKDRDSRAAVVRRPRGPKLLWEWTWKPNTGPRKTTSNGASDRDWDQELCEVRREETRLLYVAMTRAKEHLTIVKPVTRGNSREPRRWIDILKIGPMP